MKKLVLLGVLLVSGLSFSRDYTYNGRRDVVKPTIKKEQEKKNYGVEKVTPKEMGEKEYFYNQVGWDD